MRGPVCRRCHAEGDLGLFWWPIVALALSMSGAAADPLDLVQNGAFNTAAGFNPAQAGSEVTNSNLPGWQLSSCITACTSNRNNVFSFIAQSNYTTAGIYDAQFNQESTFFNGGPGGSPDGGNAYTADGGYEIGILGQMVNGLSAGQTYQLSFYQASMEQSGYPGGFTGDWKVGFGNQVQTSQQMVNASTSYTDWTKQTMDFTATSASQALLFMASANNSYPPFLLLDGVSLTAVPEPASLALVGLGVAGLLVLRRRRQTAASGAGKAA
jgi:hypothetical protein